MKEFIIAFLIGIIMALLHCSLLVIFITCGVIGIIVNFFNKTEEESI